MPRELKPRGRRAEQREKKRKAHDSNFRQISPRKRARVSDEVPNEHSHDGFDVNGDAGNDFISFGTLQTNSLPDRQNENAFYGFLDQQESDYFATVNGKIDANDFESADDKSGFIEAVHREVQGKEMKVACSQGCSRILERIVGMSSAELVRDLFGRLLGHLGQLVTHRFGSHVVESLFVRGAETVGVDEDDGKEGPTMEDLFLKAAEELKPDVGFLLTEKFASHVVRVLLLVLYGDPLQSTSTRKVVGSRKKEDVATALEETAAVADDRRRVPARFKKALNDLISTAVSGLETTYLRALATHPTGNPVLQLLLRLELTTAGKSKTKDENSLLRKLLPDEQFEKDTESAKFIQGLVYDPTGSRLIETLIQYLPGKAFKKLFRNILQHRMPDMAKNDIASYVASRVLERLSKDDLEAAMAQIMPEIPKLVSKNRLGLIKVLIERCVVRQADVAPLAIALRDAYGGEADPSTLLLKMLKLDTAPQTQPKFDKTSKSLEGKPAQAMDLHGSLLAQAMLQSPQTSPLIHTSILALPAPLLLLFAQNQTAGHILQQSLTSPSSPQIFRRQLIPKFYTHMSTLALDSSGSHVVDALWQGTQDSQFIKERLAAELAENETALRDSRYGRVVWRNWSMDLYRRRRGEWVALAKGTREQAPPNVEGAGEAQKPKSGIEKARERFAERKKMEGRQRLKQERGRGRGANRIALGSTPAVAT